jgi:hypothetical protein
VAKVATFRSYNSAPILVTSYELLVRAESEVNQVQGFFYIFAQKREFLGFFQFQEYF